MADFQWTPPPAMPEWTPPPAPDDEENLLSKGISKAMNFESAITEQLPDPARAVAETARGAGEAATTMLTGGVGQVLGGVAGLGQLGADFVSGKGANVENAVRRLNQVSDMFTYKPRTSVGERGAENIMKALEATRDAAGRGAEALTGSAVGGRTAGEVGFDLLTDVLPVGAIARAAKRRLTKPEPKPDLAPTQWEPPPVDTTKYNQMDLFTEEPSPIPPGVRSPYNLTPEQIAKAEAELNPPAEQRITGQGELFTGEKALTPDELLANKFPLSEPQRSIREMPEPFETQTGYQGRLWTVDELSRPDEMLGKKAFTDPITYEPRAVTELGTVGDARKSSQEAYREFLKSEDLIEYTPPALGLTLKGRSQRGAIGTVDQIGITKQTKVEDTLKWYQTNLDDLHYELQNTKQYLAELQKGQPSQIVQEYMRTFKKNPLELQKELMDQMKDTEGRIDEMNVRLAEAGRVFDRPSAKVVPLPSPFKGPGSRQAGALGPEFSQGVREFGKRLADTVGDAFKPLAATIYNAARAQSKQTNKNPPKTLQSTVLNAILYEKRSGEEVANSLLKRDESGLTTPTEKDISFPSKFAAHFNQGGYLADKGPILKKVVDSLDLADKRRNEIINRIKHGNEYYEGKFSPTNLGSYRKLGFTALRNSRKVESESALYYHWNRIKDSERKQVLETINEFNGVRDLTPDELKQRGFSDRMVGAYTNIRKGLDNVLEMVNASRQANGDGAFSKVPGFFPHMWFGDYRVWVYEPNSKKPVAVRGVDNMLQGNAVKNELQKQFPESEVVLERVGRSERDYNAPTEAFIEAMRLFGPTSERGKILQAAMEEILQRKGYRAHGQHREGVLGAAGTVPEGRNIMGRDRQIEMFERALDTYVNQAVRYAVNKDLQKDLHGLMGNVHINKFYPNQMGMAKNYVRNFFGDDSLLNNGFVQKYLKEMGESAVQKSSNFLIHTSLLWWRADFIATQLVQPLHVIPRLQLLKNAGIDSSIGMAALKGKYDLLFGSDEMKPVIREALEKGHIEPKFAESMDWLYFKPGGMPELTFRTVSGQSIAAAADTTSRLLSYLTYYHFFKDAGWTKAEAMEAAGRQTDTSMVAYEKFKRIPTLANTSVVGDAFSSMTTFLTNDLNALSLYAREAVRKKDPKMVISGLLPIVSKMGIYLGLAGLMGMPFLQDIEKFIETLNSLTKSNHKTPTQFLLEKGYGDMFMYGLPGEMLGIDMHGVMGGPNVTGLGRAAGVEKVGQALDAISAILAGELTQSEKFNIASTVLPRGTGRTQAEKYFMNQGRTDLGPVEKMMERPREGQPLPQPRRDMAGGYPMTKEDWLAHQFGTKTTKEGRWTEANRQLERNLREQREIQKHKMSLVVDQLLSGEPDQQKVVRLLQEYIKEGKGNPAGIQQSLQDKLKSRILDGVKRKILQGKSGTIQQMQQLHMLEQQLGSASIEELVEAGQGLR